MATPAKNPPGAASAPQAPAAAPSGPQGAPSAPAKADPPPAQEAASAGLPGASVVVAADPPRAPADLPRLELQVAELRERVRVLEDASASLAASRDAAAAGLSESLGPSGPVLVARRVRQEQGDLAPPQVSAEGDYVEVPYNMRKRDRDDVEVSVSGGNVRDLHTGYAFDVPEGYAAHVSVRQSNGDWATVLTLTGAGERELVVPFRNVYHVSVLRATSGRPCARIRLQPLLRCSLRVVEE